MASHDLAFHHWVFLSHFVINVEYGKCTEVSLTLSSDSSFLICSPCTSITSMLSIVMFTLATDWLPEHLTAGGQGFWHKFLHTSRCSQVENQGVETNTGSGSTTTCLPLHTRDQVAFVACLWLTRLLVANRGACLEKGPAWPRQVGSLRDLSFPILCTSQKPDWGVQGGACQPTSKPSHQCVVTDLWKVQKDFGRGMDVSVGVWTGEEVHASQPVSTSLPPKTRREQFGLLSLSRSRPADISTGRATQSLSIASPFFFSSGFPDRKKNTPAWDQTVSPESHGDDAWDLLRFMCQLSPTSTFTRWPPTRFRTSRVVGIPTEASRPTDSYSPTNELVQILSELGRKCPHTAFSAQACSANPCAATSIPPKSGPV